MKDLTALKKIASELSGNSIEFVVGGSGLGYLLGINQEVNDWDIMTDAPFDEVKRCLSGYELAIGTARPPYRSKYLISLEIDGCRIEVIGGFALEIDGRLHEFPATGSLVKKGLPLAEIDSWIKIYALLGHEKKAAALRSRS